VTRIYDSPLTARGTPRLRVMAIGIPIERFWAHVRKTDGCWLWTGAADSNGYGSFNVGAGQYERAHVFAWEADHGPVPPGLEVCHNCDVPRCVRHLFLGTHLENMRDMAAKGRWRNQTAGVTHCVKGHEFNAENTVYKKNGRHRRCLICKRRQGRETEARRRAREKAARSLEAVA
jgi:hypothetical protein